MLKASRKPHRGARSSSARNLPPQPVSLFGESKGVGRLTSWRRGSRPAARAGRRAGHARLGSRLERTL